MPYLEQGLVHWWLSGLTRCLPQRLKKRRGDKKEYLLDLIGDQAALGMRTESGVQPVGRISLDLAPAISPFDNKSVPVVMQLPTATVLIRHISLPLAVEKNLRDALKYEMDRLTPFSADQVFYDFRVLARDRERQKFSVELAVVRKSDITPWIEWLKANGVIATKATSSSLWERANLLPEQFRAQKKSGTGRQTWVLFTILMVLCAIALIGPLWKKRAQVIELGEQLNVVRNQADVVVALKDRLDERNLLSGHVIEMRNQYVPAVELLRELTDRLPDDTWVLQLDTRGNRVEVRGESEQATQLISVLEDSPLFNSVTFRSPVVQMPRTDSERFHISMDVEHGEGQ
ncbi:MAG: hypothetical protein C0631_09470 [Sedimenticola sp.]|nr:MAG: hypothetical protein C0631_09470 [Sedimenticola sp.]